MEIPISLLKIGKDRKYVEMRIRDQSVLIERVPEEEIKDWLARVQQENLRKLSISSGVVEVERFARPERIVNQTKALAIYRLLWYFGSPQEARATSDYSCIYTLRYKGHVFDVVDRPGNQMWLYSIHLVKKEEWDQYSRGGIKPEELAPPKEIRKEFVSLIEYLVKNPVQVSTSGGLMQI